MFHLSCRHRILEWSFSFLNLWFPCVGWLSTYLSMHLDHLLPSLHSFIHAAPMLWLSSGVFTANMCQVRHRTPSQPCTLRPAIGTRLENGNISWIRTAETAPALAWVHPMGGRGDTMPYSSSREPLMYNPQLPTPLPPHC